MLIHVRLNAGLVRHFPGARAGETLNVEIPDGSDVRGLTLQLGIPEGEIHVRFVNGRARGADWQLEPGDEVGLFPAVGGG